ncbi:MAG TPA: 2-C-methyl-D-erythritol 2,4-cyclodiphosphate synthase [Balneolales bacterium]|nr:2-C-methyl-D-erythritol 2,4-cyclodiphosphate synthase [Balneolales bacterium]
MMRIGYGYDVHRLVSGRPLVLGGVTIPHEKGLEGHSDADALLHAITDALLGALALGDIGQHFPDNDPAYKQIDSRILLRKAYDLVRENGFLLANMDATLIAEQPKLMNYITDMRSAIADDLNCRIDQISVKATTSEKMGFAGREEGIAAMAVVLLERENDN